MRRFEIVAEGVVRLRTDVPVPEPAAGQVRVRVRACTVCNRSDLVYVHWFSRRDHCRTGCFGHEVAGEIDAVGPGVSGFAPGERVFLRSPLTSGFAEFVLAREVCVGRLPTELDFAAGAALQLLPLAIHASRNVQLGDRVTIVGLGPVGQMMARVCRERGAEVTGLDLDPWRLAQSPSLSRAEVVTAEELSARIQALPPADVAVDAVGTPGTLRAAVAGARVGGRVVALGTHHIDGQVGIDFVQVEKKGLTIESAAEATDSARAEALRVAERIATRIDPASLITHRFPLESLPKALELLAHNPTLSPEGSPLAVRMPPPLTLKVAILP